ncbi:MAG TPA: c-type cytochrome [Acidobacteriaceae bacterium]|jgi:mono/diheme cytochrome c family protein
MSKHMSVLLLAGASFVALAACAQQPIPKIAKVPIKPTLASDGHQMFTTYCAVCHGVDGRGSGPAASALKAKPVDLTLLSHQNGDVFPSKTVTSVLRFGVETPAHGSTEMPIWGELMRNLSPDKRNSSMIVQQRIDNLASYLKTIQVQAGQPATQPR